MIRKEKITENKKVAVIGAGFVGASIAYALTLKNIADEIVLIDIDTEKASGEVQDIRHGLSDMGIADIYAGDYSDCADCDLIVITAGRNRRQNESRLDLLSDNVEIIKNVIVSISRYYTRGVILVVSNPMDILTYKAAEWMGLPDGMVFGSGCLLDTSRLVRQIADYVRTDTMAVRAYLVGEHGDGQTAIWSKITVEGITIAEYCREAGLIWDGDVRRAISEKIRYMGSEIIRMKGKTHYGIASCVCYLADAIINQKTVVVSVTSPLQGEYGLQGVALSVPSVIGASGVQQRIQEQWTSEEYRSFCTAAEKERNVLMNIK